MKRDPTDSDSASDGDQYSAGFEGASHSADDVYFEPANESAIRPAEVTGVDEGAAQDASHIATTLEEVTTGSDQRFS